jgi:hypothetical protein
MKKKVAVVLPPEGTGPEAHALHIVAACRGRAEGLPAFKRYKPFLFFADKRGKISHCICHLHTFPTK